ncbi:hypothetical protein F5Y16DRAFT_133499 [Xylariaceae sp. FL0255]|nr:hypothetical protein F5Y16DRAFT_133499 [Xylariaceae sp. FL0255]
MEDSLRDREASHHSENMQLSLRGNPTGTALIVGGDLDQAPHFQDCSWDQVLEAMENAKNEHESRNKGLRSLPRNRAIVRTLHSLADTIPDQNGLSVVRGGLKTIFELLDKRIENRDKILETFEDIPLMFSKACEAFKNQPDDVILRSDVETLCKTLNNEISGLILILNPERRKFSVQRMFKRHPEHIAASIETCLGKINRAAQKVTIRAEALINGIVVENLREVKRVGCRVDETHTQVAGLYPSLDQIHSHQLEQERKQALGLEQQEDFFRLLSQKLEYMEAWFKDGLLHLQQDFHRQLNYVSNPYYHLPYTCTTEPEQGLRGCLPDQRPTLLITSHEQDEHLVYIESTNHDLEEVTRRHNSFNKHAVARASWLLAVERFQIWMQFTNHQSDLVLVDGYLGDHTVGKISPLSLVTVALQTLVDQHPQSVLLYFFCGLHTWDEDIPAGPKGMMQSLIAQLIFRLSLLSPAITPTLSQLYEKIGRCNSEDLNQLCLLFSALVSLFPEKTTIYCIINDISEFETDHRGWEEELCGIFEYFRDLIGHQAVSTNVTLKVLLTVAHRSIAIRQRLHTDEHVSLEAGNKSSHGSIPLFTRR